MSYAFAVETDLTASGRVNTLLDRSYVIIDANTRIQAPVATTTNVFVPSNGVVVVGVTASERIASTDYQTPTPSAALVRAVERAQHARAVIVPESEHEFLDWLENS